MRNEKQYVLTEEKAPLVCTNANEVRKHFSANAFAE